MLQIIVCAQGVLIGVSAVARLGLVLPARHLGSVDSRLIEGLRHDALPEIAVVVVRLALIKAAVLTAGSEAIHIIDVHCRLHVSLRRFFELAELVTIVGLPLLGTPLHDDLLNLHRRLATLTNGLAHHELLPELLLIEFIIRLPPNEGLLHVPAVVVGRATLPETRELVQLIGVHLRLVNILVR